MVLNRPIFQPQITYSIHGHRSTDLRRDQCTVNLLEPSFSGPWNSPIFRRSDPLSIHSLCSIVYVSRWKVPLAMITFSVKIVINKEFWFANEDIWLADFFSMSLIFSWNFQIARTDSRTPELWKKRKHVFVQNQIASHWIVKATFIRISSWWSRWIHSGL